MDRLETALKGTRGGRVHIRMGSEGKPAEVAGRLARIFSSCGYATRVVIDPDGVGQGLQLRARIENAAQALVIQSAFKSAGMDVVLSIASEAPGREVILYVGGDVEI